MRAIEQIQKQLRKYPHVTCEMGESSTTVLPTSSKGFSVGLELTGMSLTVFFNGWHENFEREEEALDCFAFGLSDQCRLKECRRGSFAYRSTVNPDKMANGLRIARPVFSFSRFGKQKPSTICRMI